MLFENLLNEIFIEIFSYLNEVDVLLGFTQLNYRFQCLIQRYCQTFDFKSIVKSEFDFIFQNFSTENWKSLQLSDEKCFTSGQIEYFFRFFAQHKRFSQLKSLSILGKKQNNMFEILFKLSPFANLILLTIKPVCGRRISNVELPQLNSLVISSCGNIDWLEVSKENIIILKPNL